MKYLIYVMAVFFGLANTIATYAQSKPVISKSDIEPLIGNWQGSLTYLDYSSNKPYTMPADLVVNQIGSGNSFTFANLYPDEPRANSIDTITISNDGTMINDEIIQSKKTIMSHLEVITEVSGKDGNENNPATIRHIYIVGKDIFSIKKEVQFIGQTEWIKRQEYAYKKKN